MEMELQRLRILNLDRLSLEYELLRPVCAPGYTGHKRGEVVRTRTTLLQAHTHRWLGMFGGEDNGNCRGELLQGLEEVLAYERSTSASCLLRPSFELPARLAWLDGSSL